jgi:hypothetical protein
MACRHQSSSGLADPPSSELFMLKILSWPSGMRENPIAQETKVDQPCSLRHPPIIRTCQRVSRLARPNAEFFEDARIERILSASSFQDASKVHSQQPVNPRHLGYSWLTAASHKSVAQFAEYSRNSPAVNVGVRTVKIAQ